MITLSFAALGALAVFLGLVFVIIGAVLGAAFAILVQAFLTGLMRGAVHSSRD